MTKRRPDPRRRCRCCGKRMPRKRFGKTLEDLSAFKRRKYCDRLCMAQAMQRGDVGRNAYHARARKWKGSACERCGATSNLHAHHRDEDITNNVQANIETVCAVCHMKQHWTEKPDARPRRRVRMDHLGELLGLCELASKQIADPMLADAIEQAAHRLR